MSCEGFCKHERLRHRALTELAGEELVEAIERDKQLQANAELARAMFQQALTPKAEVSH